MNEWTNGQIDELIDRRMNGQMDRSTYTNIVRTIVPHKTTPI